MNSPAGVSELFLKLIGRRASKSKKPTGELHLGTPNTTNVPRALATIRCVRRWYADARNDVDDLPRATWESLTTEQYR